MKMNMKQSTNLCWTFLVKFFLLQAASINHAEEFFSFKFISRGKSHGNDCNLLSRSILWLWNGFSTKSREWKKYYYVHFRLKNLNWEEEFSHKTSRKDFRCSSSENWLNRHLSFGLAFKNVKAKVLAEMEIFSYFSRDMCGWIRSHQTMTTMTMKEGFNVW